MKGTCGINSIAEFICESEVTIGQRLRAASDAQLASLLGASDGQMYQALVHFFVIRDMLRRTGRLETSDLFPFHTTAGSESGS